MITIIQAPAENRVLLDANNTVIVLQSSNGAGHYFRAIISVNDQPFDEQGWSRKDNFTASKDLVKLYNAYFDTVQKTFVANSLTEQTNLIKKISITVQEKRLEDDSVTGTVTLPTFYFMYNVNPEVFYDSNKIEIIGLTPPVLRVPNNGKIMIPFYANANNEDVVVTLTNYFGTIINQQNASLSTGKKVFMYSFDLATTPGIKDNLYFTATITCGAATVVKNYRVMRFPDYNVKEIYFKNNFGYYIPAYFDGELEAQDGFKVDDYKQADGTNVVFEINEEATYTINTGSLLQDERAIVNQIATAHEVLLKVNNQWRKIQTKTSKLLAYRDKKHLYSQDLIFSFVKNGKVSNYYDSDLEADWDGKDFLETDFLT